MKQHRGLTLIELMLVIVIAGVLLALAAPSFRDFILLQRLKGVSSQIVTDMQFARSEAAARNTFVRVRFSNDSGKTCYAIFTGTTGACNCRNSPICTAGGGGEEIRTVSVNRDDLVLITPQVAPAELAYDPTTGAIVTPALDTSGDPVSQFMVDTCIDRSNCTDKPQRIRLEIKLSGRPGLCSPADTTVGLTAC